LLTIPVYHVNKTPLLFITNHKHETPHRLRLIGTSDEVFPGRKTINNQV
jgi:hypothetical protein